MAGDLFFFRFLNGTKNPGLEQRRQHTHTLQRLLHMIPFAFLIHWMLYSNRCTLCYSIKRRKKWVLDNHKQVNTFFASFYLVEHFFFEYYNNNLYGLCLCVCVWYSSVVHSMHCVYTIYLCCCLPNHCFGFSASWHRLITLTMTEKKDEQTNTPVQSYWCIVNKCTEHTTFFFFLSTVSSKMQYIYAILAYLHLMRLNRNSSAPNSSTLN